MATTFVPSAPARIAKRGTAGYRWATAILLLVLALQVELTFSKSVNWDEFFHFSQIHQHLLGRPVPWLQTPYVLLFSWVPGLPGSDIDHIQLIRLLMLAFEMMTIAAVVGVARRFASREAALLCGLLYASGGYVFLHGFALRADMIATALLMTALWIGLCRPLRAAETLLAVVLVALAFVSTIKTVLYAPAILGVILFRAERPDHRRWILISALLVAVAGAALLAIAPFLPEVGPAGALRDLGALGRDALARMFPGTFLPQRGALERQAVMAPLLSLVLLIGLYRAGSGADDRAPRFLSLLLFAPLATVAFYFNSFPYHFAFILPPAVVAAAPAADWLLRSARLAPLALFLLVNAAILSGAEDRDILPRQRAIEAGVDVIFPARVTYIDNSGMIGRFPRAVDHFASGWGLENYRQAGVPAYAQAISAEPVPLLLANNVVLQNAFFETSVDAHLLPEDERMLRDTYIPHWGLVFVAGKVFPAGDGARTFPIAVPGTYTVEGSPITIDGKKHAVGDLVHLRRGDHILTGERAAAATLRWGDHLRRPARDWPKGDFFSVY